RELLRRAIGRFAPEEHLARARCAVAEAEIALATREVTGPPRALESALSALDARGDRVNAMHARLIAIRRLLLIGRVGEAGAALAEVDLRGMPAPLVALAELTTADLAIRSLRARDAHAALGRARAAAERAHVPALIAEVEEAEAMLARPVARRVRAGVEEAITLEALEASLASSELVVDACRRAARAGSVYAPLHKRPVLFALLRMLAESWPHGATRESLIARAFEVRRVNDSHRARLRVEIGRLRRLLAPVAAVRATAAGFALTPTSGTVTVLLPPIDGDEASLLALLSDGEAWSTSSLSLALGESQRNVQRALADLEETGRVRAVGGGRNRRWLAPPVAGFATTLLLPTTLPFT
ncbi:MAG: helix-turn-helix domain-containing protein, partial [Polyangiaceae bacterium]|nr:helix-turn-helix domain-containing protein [Polyangiaceae bacterium]